MSNTPSSVPPPPSKQGLDCCDWDDCKFFQVVTQGNCNNHCKLPKGHHEKLYINIENMTPSDLWVTIGLESQTGQTNYQAIHSPSPRYTCEKINGRGNRDFEFEIWHTTGIPGRTDHISIKLNYYHQPTYCGNSRKNHVPNISISPIIEYR